MPQIKRKIITLDEEDGQLSTVLRARDIQKLKSIIEDYQSCGEFSSEFYACLFKLCDWRKTDDEILQVMLGCNRFDVNKKQRNGEAIVHALSRNNQYRWIQHLLEIFPNLDVDSVNENMKTPFLLAAEFGRVEVLELLEPIVQDIRCCDKKKCNALHWMAKHGNLKWVKYFIEKKAFELEQKNVYGDTPLNRAFAFGQYECCQYLMQIGASLLQIDVDGKTMLHAAVFGGNIRCLDAVLEHIVKDECFVNLRDKKGKTALNWAAGKGNKEMVISLLKANADVNQKELDGRTALLWASVGGHEDIIKLLIDADANIDVNDLNEKKYQPLTRAAFKRHIGAVKILLEAGANVNITDNFGLTALDWAASKGDVRLVNYLLQRENIDVNSKSSIGVYTPLMRAAKRGNVYVMRALIKANANIDLQNWFGETALILAVLKKDLPCVVELVENKAKLNLRNKHGETALTIAKKWSWNRNIIKVLVDAGAEE